jgi:thymidylate synthase
MPYCFEGETADDVWCDGARALLSSADTKIQDSRLGPTRELLHASFLIKNPRERWVLSRQPGLNPAFAIAEVFWILAGRNDSLFINYWNSQYCEYAGNENLLHGAYGFRLRRQFGQDQLERAFAALESRPISRQIVLSIWDGRSDLPSNDGSPISQDVPCNVCSLLKVRDGRLEWMQVMRSNDLFLGTPYNFIQFTTLQEVMAGWLGLDVGSYCHLSDSLHVYENYEESNDKFSVSQRTATAKNCDQLGLPKAEFDATLGKVIDILDAFTSPTLSAEQFRSLSANDEVPNGYRNLMLIAAADAARRRKWYSGMDSALSQCTNPLLLSVWENWRRQYVSGKVS